MSFFIMLPAGRAAAVDVDVEQLVWEIMEKEGIPWSCELVVREP